MEKIEKRLLGGLRKALGKEVEVRPEALGPQKTPKFMRLGKPQQAVVRSEPYAQLMPPPPAQEMMLPPPILGAQGAEIAPPPPMVPSSDPMMAPAPQTASGPPLEPNPFDLARQSGGW